MPKSLSVLCIHGVGHGDADQDLEAAWSGVIEDGIAGWNPGLQGAVTCHFLQYDTLFEKAPLNDVTYAQAFARLIASGIVHGIGDLFTRERGLFEIPDRMRWTAGMVAQWVSDEKLRQAARNAILAMMAKTDYDVICAHSLGSLICYDTFLANPKAIEGKTFVSFGSQIGNPLVRSEFAGRLVPLADVSMWFHLFNPEDHAFTADIRMGAPNFEEVGTRFDIPNDALNHNALWYLGHQNTRATVWRIVAGTKVPEALERGLQTFCEVRQRPERRALLVGINDYPDPAHRLEGCVNDVFLMSSVLQECGFDAKNIRVVLNERATAAGIRDRLHWLLDGVRPGEERVFFYSGHGAQMAVYGPTDEVDHMDECLAPHDFDWTLDHAITDKQFLDLYSQLPYDSNFIGIIDCCHAAGMTRDGGRKIRGISPPDDIRHRAMAWNAELQMWEERPLETPNRTLMEDDQGADYLGSNGATYRLGRAIKLRTLPQKKYDAVRGSLNHLGPYLPVIMEACQENQLAHEYRHGVQSYGAFTFSLAAALRADRGKGKNPSFTQLMKDVSARLAQLKYDQVPNLVGAAKILAQPIPWSGKPAQEEKKKKAGKRRSSK